MSFEYFYFIIPHTDCQCVIRRVQDIILHGVEFDGKSKIRSFHTYLGASPVHFESRGIEVRAEGRLSLTLVADNTLTCRRALTLIQAENCDH